MTNVLPWFPLYAGDWIRDEDVQCMSRASEADYLRLLCYQWAEGSIPADPRKIRRLLKPMSDGEWAETWAEIGEKFPPVEGAPDRLANPRLDAIRAQKATASATAAAKAKRRWAATPADPVAEAPPIACPSIAAEPQQSPGYTPAMLQHSPSTAAALPQLSPGIAAAKPRQCESESDPEKYYIYTSAGAGGRAHVPGAPPAAPAPAYSLEDLQADLSSFVWHTPGQDSKPPRPVAGILCEDHVQGELRDRIVDSARLAAAPPREHARRLLGAFDAFRVSLAARPGGLPPPLRPSAILRHLATCEEIAAGRDPAPAEERPGGRARASPRPVDARRGVHPASTFGNNPVAVREKF